MSGTFTESAVRLAALAARVLGWRPVEFWAATPAELALSLGTTEPAEAPNRAEMMTMIAQDRERDRDGRSD